MFVDEVEIEVFAGGGGNGMVTFRKEKHVPRGGPNGGDGGHGGSVMLRVDTNLTTLLDFRYQRKYKAQRGGDGGSKDMFGRDAVNLVLRVPQGTVVTDAETGTPLADLSEPDSEAIVARGGIGGRGNAHFVTSIHQAPRFAENGEPGEEKRLRLELKLLADVGLLGFPNVGKSTLIAAVSAARPKIANYPFTTLTPNLGVVYVEAERSFVMADIPGIIEGASEGVGLGHQFLRHVARSRLLIHILDVSGMTGREPLVDFDVLNRELELYDENLARLPQVIVLNKIDVMADPDAVDALESTLTERGHTVFRISAATREGLKQLVYETMTRLESIRAELRAAAERDEASGVVRFTAAPEQDDRRWEAREVSPGLFEVVGRGIERMVSMTDLENDHAVRRLQRSLDKIGITARLKAIGAADGDTVRIRGIEFEYEDEARLDREIEAEISAARTSHGSMSVEAPCRIVVKVGTSTLMDTQGRIDRSYIDDLTSQLSRIHSRGADALLVTSGAIRAGRERLAARAEASHLRIDRRAADSLPGKQAAAALGQGVLIHTYSEAFAKHGVDCAQVLLCRDDLSDRRRFLNARNALSALLDLGVIPVINENDTVAVDEIKFGDNDSLAALVATLVDADLLMILSDVDGLYSRPPVPGGGPPPPTIPVVRKIDPSIMELAAGARLGSAGTGGMAAKVNAAKIATQAGIRTVIASGRKPDVVSLIVDGNAIGTTFLPAAGARIKARKRWIAHGARPRGYVTVNGPALERLRTGGVSLLAAGIVDTSGEFAVGDLIEMRTDAGRPFARGLVNYAAHEVRRVLGMKSEQFESVLGYRGSDEIVHRDNLAIDPDFVV